MAFDIANLFPVAIAAASLFISLLIFLAGAYSGRRSRHQLYAEQTAVDALAPLLSELQVLINKCTLLAKYPSQTQQMERFWDLSALKGHIARILVILDDRGLQADYINLLLMIDQLNFLIRNHKEDIDLKKFRESIIILSELIMPLRNTLEDILKSYRERMGIRIPISYEPTEKDRATQPELVLAILNESFGYFPPKVTAELPKQVDKGLKKLIKELDRDSDL